MAELSEFNSTGAAALYCSCRSSSRAPFQSPVLIVFFESMKKKEANSILYPFKLNLEKQTPVLKP